MESILLKERWSLLDRGVDRKCVFIKGYKLYINSKLHGQETPGGFCNSPSLGNVAPSLLALANSSQPVDNGSVETSTLHLWVLTNLLTKPTSLLKFCLPLLFLPPPSPCTQPPACFWRFLFVHCHRIDNSLSYLLMDFPQSCKQVFSFPVAGIHCRTFNLCCDCNMAIRLSL